MIPHLERINANNQIRFKTSMLKSSLCDYSHAYILIKETISIPGRGVKQYKQLKKKKE